MCLNAVRCGVVQAKCANVCWDSAYRLGRHPCLFVYLNFCVLFIHSTLAFLFFSSAQRLKIRVREIDDAFIIYYLPSLACVSAAVSCFVYYLGCVVSVQGTLCDTDPLVYGECVCASENMVLTWALSHFIQIIVFAE